MAANTKSKVTTDHEEIRRWAAARNGTPAVILRFKTDDDGVAPITIHFPGDRSENSLDEVSWEAWFKKFDAAGLALLYQENTAGGEQSNFNKLVGREAVDEVEAAVGGKGRSASRRRSRRPPAVGEVATLPGKPQKNAARSAGAGKINKRSVATVARVAPGKKQPPTPKTSRDKNS